jgi:hypothetical protein
MRDLVLAFNQATQQDDFTEINYPEWFASVQAILQPFYPDRELRSLVQDLKDWEEIATHPSNRIRRIASFRRILDIFKDVINISNMFLARQHLQYVPR